MRWWCQFIDWLKSETRPSSLLKFGTAYEVYESSCTSLTENNENLLHSDIITALQIGHLLLFGWPVFDSREILLVVRQFIVLSNGGEYCWRQQAKVGTSIFRPEGELVRLIMLCN